MSCATHQYTGCDSVPIGNDFKSAITKNGFDLTGYIITMTIRERNAASDTLVLSIVNDEVTSGIYIPDPQIGRFIIQIRKEQTALIAAGAYTYKIELLSPGGDLEPLIAGDINFIEVG